MSFLNQTATGQAIGAITGTSSVDRALNSENYTPQDFEKNGFIVPPVPSGDGNGLPSHKVRSQQRGIAKRDMAHWFVPEVGVINMYINPQSISYSNKKLITPQRTKGGYNIQYWGEELTTMQIGGHTGSSGIEGLNVLYEIYRAEQYLYDPIALTMAADNSISGLSDMLDSALGNLGGFGDAISDATSGLLGLNPAGQNILPRTVPSLSSIALGIELYWQGWVFRGFFTSFNFSESVDKMGLYTYDIAFTVTQRRGYRLNNFPWQHSAISGPSDHKSIPLSFTGLQSQNPKIR